MFKENTNLFQIDWEKNQTIHQKFIVNSNSLDKYVIRYIPQTRQLNGKPINYIMLIDFYYNNFHFCVELAHFEYLDQKQYNLFLDQVKNPFFEKKFQVIEYEMFGVTRDIPVVIIQANDILKQAIDTFVNVNNKHSKRKPINSKFYCIKLDNFTMEEISVFFPIGTCINGTDIYIKKI